jgi:hypothetical protein
VLMSEERFEDCPIAVNEKDYERHIPVPYYNFYVNALHSYKRSEIISPNGVDAEYGAYRKTKKAQE